MPFLHNLLNRHRRLFEGPEAPLRGLYPVFEAMEGFFFLAAKRTESAPHVRDAVELKRYMSAVIVALAPVYVFGLVVFGPRLLLMTAVSYAVGGTVEVLFAAIRKKDIHEGFLVTGLIFPMVLPPSTPLWVVGLGVAFGAFFGKEVFGGTGHNVFNPALVGRCFVTLSWPSILAGAYTEPFAWLRTALEGGKALGEACVGVTGATPLAQINEVIRSGGDFAVLSMPTLKMYVGLTAGSVCETSAVLILLSGLWLCWTRVGNWRVPAAILAVYVVLGLIFSSDLLWPQVFASPLLGLGAGGLLFGAFFMATDPVTSPVSNWGKVIYGVGIGVLVLLIRGMGAVPEGVTYAILLMNMFAPLIDRQVMRRQAPVPLPRRATNADA